MRRFAFTLLVPLFFAALAALAGLPAVAGIWLGSYAFAPHWAALAFSQSRLG